MIWSIEAFTPVHGWQVISGGYDSSVPGWAAELREQVRELQQEGYTVRIVREGRTCPKHYR